MAKCPVCTYDVKVEEAIYNTKTKRYYHAECYQELLDRKKLCDYICEIYGLKRPNTKMFSQMGNYHENGTSYSDMLLALRYFFEVKGGNINKTNEGIGIIPYVLHEAREFATLEEMDKKKLIEKFERLRKEQLETKVIHIGEEQKREKKIINIDNL